MKRAAQKKAHRPTALSAPSKLVPANDLPAGKPAIPSALSKDLLAVKPTVPSVLSDDWAYKAINAAIAETAKDNERLGYPEKFVKPGSFVAEYHPPQKAPPNLSIDEFLAKHDTAKKKHPKK